MPSPSPYNATLVDRRDFHEDLAVFRVAYDDGPAPPFLPGQFTTLGLVRPEAGPGAPPSVPKPVVRRGRPGRVPMVRRAYSIASAPGESEALSFYVVCVREGRFTPLLWGLRPGDRLWMSRKVSGHFTLEGIPEGKTLVMVGTGTGVAPFRAMYHAHRHTGRWGRLVLMEGCRLARDLGYRQEFEALAGQDPSLTYLPTVTREPAGSPWPGLRGRVTQHLEPGVFRRLAGVPLSPETCHVLLCGNPAMIDQCEALLSPLGFVTRDRRHPDGNLHFERYW